MGTNSFKLLIVRADPSGRFFAIEHKIGMEVHVLTGEEEARLAYLGVLQFLPIHDKLALTVDIGGSSIEFVIGKEGKAIFGTSLKLEHGFEIAVGSFGTIRAIHKAVFRGYASDIVDKAALFGDSRRD